MVVKKLMMELEDEVKELVREHFDVESFWYYILKYHDEKWGARENFEGLWMLSCQKFMENILGVVSQKH